MNKKVVSTNLRLNLKKEADRRAWENLQRLGRDTHKSYTQVIIMAINDFYDRQMRLIADPYLETREKEDAFLQSVLETITKGLQGTAALGMTEGMQTPLQGITTTNTASVSASNVEREDAINAALDFVNSF
jgi:hypothetical protein